MKKLLLLSTCWLFISCGMLQKTVVSDEQPAEPPQHHLEAITPQEIAQMVRQQEGLLTLYKPYDSLALWSFDLRPKIIKYTSDHAWATAITRNYRIWVQEQPTFQFVLVVLNNRRKIEAYYAWENELLIYVETFNKQGASVVRQVFEVCPGHYDRGQNYLEELYKELYRQIARSP